MVLTGNTDGGTRGGGVMSLNRSLLLSGWGGRLSGSCEDGVGGRGVISGNVGRSEGAGFWTEGGRSCCLASRAIPGPSQKHTVKHQIDPVFERPTTPFRVELHTHTSRTDSLNRFE